MSFKGSTEQEGQMCKTTFTRQGSVKRVSRDQQLGKQAEPQLRRGRQARESLPEDSCEGRGGTGTHRAPTAAREVEFLRLKLKPKPALKTHLSAYRKWHLKTKQGPVSRFCR